MIEELQVDFSSVGILMPFHRTALFIQFEKKRLFTWNGWKQLY